MRTSRVEGLEPCILQPLPPRRDAIPVRMTSGTEHLREIGEHFLHHVFRIVAAPRSGASCYFSSTRTTLSIIKLGPVSASHESSILPSSASSRMIGSFAQ